MATKVKIAATKDDFEQAGKDQGEFIVPPNGYYVLQLKECNPGLSKDDDGNEDKKRPRLECIWEITGVGAEDNAVEENYGNVWDYVALHGETGWKRAQFLKATGVTDGTEEFDGTIDVDDLIGTKIIGRLARQRGRTKDDPARAKLRSMMSFEDADAGAAFGGEGDEGEDPAQDDAEDYTEEELMAMEPKALGKVAKEEFQLEPSEFVVKVRNKVSVPKSQEKLVAAILEAQADDAAGETATTDEGESPF